MRSKSSHQMDSGLQDLASELPPPAHQAKMLAGAKQKIERKQKMKQRINRISWGTGIAAVVMIIMLVVPITYEVTVGSMVSLAGLPVDESFDTICAELASLTNLQEHHVTITKDTADFQLAFRKLSGPKAASQVKEILARHTANPAQLELLTENIVKEVGGNALAFATGGVISVNITGLDDDEVAAAIVARLEEAGYENSSAEVTTEDGVSTVDISISLDEDSVDEGSSTETITIELTDDEAER